MKRDFRRLKRRGNGWVCECWDGSSFVSRSLFPRSDPRLRDPSQSDPRLQRAWARFSQGKPVPKQDATHRARELAAEVLEAALQAAPLALATIIDEETHGPGKGGRKRQRSTRDAIRVHLHRFRDWIAERHAEVLQDYRRTTRGVAHEFVHLYLVEQGLADGTRRAARAHLRRMFEAANERHGEVVGEILNPFGRVTVPAVPQDERRRQIEQEFALTDDEIERLIAAAGHDQAPMYLRPWLVLALTTGCRRGELLATIRYDHLQGKQRTTFKSGLLWKYIHWDRGYVSVRGKTGPRDVPLIGKAVEELNRYRRKLIDVGMLIDDVFVRDHLGSGGKPQPIISPRGAFDAALRRAGICRHVRIHDLRHSALSFYARRGMAPHAIRDLAGHSSLQVTDLYTHSRRDEILDAVARAHESDPNGARSGVREQSAPDSLPVTRVN